MNKILISFLGLSLFGFGCSMPSFSQAVADKYAESAVEKATGGKIDVSSDKGTVSYQDKDGNQISVGENAAMPANFPKEIPQYPGGTTLSASVAKDGQASLSIRTSDASAVVMSWMETTLTKDGWKQASQMASGDFSVRTYTKDKATIGVTIVPDGEGKGGSLLTITKS